MEKEIKCRDRLVRMGDLPDVMELKAFVQEMDEKYGVCSDDTENSFGIINPEYALVTALYESNIYFSLNGCDGKDTHLPKWGQVVLPKNQVLSAGSRLTQKTALMMEEADKKELFHLRRKAAAAIKAVYPKTPAFEKETSAREMCDAKLREQGFADSSHAFGVKFKIDKGVDDWFSVEYKILELNKSPYFSTRYHGFQNQEELSQESLAYQFHKKWNIFHLVTMTIEEFEEMAQDVEELKTEYRWRAI